MSRYGRVLFAGALALGIAGQAQAISISGLTITANGPNTADGKTDTVTNYNENRSTRTVLDSGGSALDSVGSQVDAATRYAAITVADGGVATTASRNATHDYKITFTVSSAPFILYNVIIDTSRLGNINRVDDGTGGATGSVGAVTGRVNGIINATLGLGGVSLAQGTNNANTNINQTTSTLTLSGLTGTNVITLDFSWTSAVNSTCSGFLCSTTGNDEIAVRLGMTGTGSGTPGTTADDYPGSPSRNINNDGHFVGIKALVTVPEPGTLSLLGLGLGSLAVLRRRARAA
jgi:hypothetical protein